MSNDRAIPGNLQNHIDAMAAQNEIAKTRIWIEYVDSSLKNILDNYGELLPVKVKRISRSVVHYRDEIRKLLDEGPVESRLLDDKIATLSDRALNLLLAAREENAETYIVAEIAELNNIIQKKVGDTVRDTTEGVDIAAVNIETQKLAGAIGILEVQLSNHQKDTNSLRKSLLESSKLAELLEDKMLTLGKRIDEAVEESSKKIDVIIVELKEKQDEANKLVELVSGNAIAGSYVKSAENEKKFADATRYGALVLMLLVVAIIGDSFLRMSRPSFDWITAAFRLLFSLALSVPAAYLARESAKHRTQQYAYMRVSLDLQAITPYLASLPVEEQHKLKIDVANRIFGGKDVAINPLEAYPLNVQELFLALISKMNADKKEEKAKG
jgi:hypothetical protein